MYISESEIRSLIREAFSQQQLEKLLDRARDMLLKYVDDPTKGDKTFKERLNKRLKQLNRSQLTKEELQDIKQYFNDITIGTTYECRTVTGRECDGYFSAAEKYIGLDPDYISLATEGNIFETIYHELSHGLDTVFKMILYQKADDLYNKKKYRSQLGLSQAAADVDQEIKRFKSERKPSESAMTTLFKKEISDMQDASLLSNDSAWNRKVKELLPRSVRTGGISNILAPHSARVTNVLKEPDHVYTSIQQLRRAFPGKSLSSICNLTEKELLKLDYWPLMFLISFRCDNLSDNAYETIATKQMTSKSSTKIV